MSGGLLRTAARFLTGGKFHWRTIPTALVGANLLSGPRTRMDPAYGQLGMYNQMGGFNQGAVTAGGYNPNAGTGRPF